MNRTLTLRLPLTSITVKITVTRAPALPTNVINAKLAS